MGIHIGQLRTELILHVRRMRPRSLDPKDLLSNLREPPTLLDDAASSTRINFTHTTPDTRTTTQLVYATHTCPSTSWTLYTRRTQHDLHYRKQSLHRELEASARAKSAALGEAPLRRERKVWLSAKDWPTVISTFAESFLSSALGEGLG
jgi:hypothetical protein